MTDEELELHAERLDFSFTAGKKILEKVAGIDTRYGIRSADDLVLFAIESCGIEKTKALFEAQNPEDILRRMHAVEYIVCESLPVMSHDSLSVVTEELYSHLETNSRSLLQWGLPAVSFARSPWHCVRLNRLYYTKQPFVHPLSQISMIITNGTGFITNSGSTQFRRTAEGNIAYDFKWSVYGDSAKDSGISREPVKDISTRATSTSDYSAASTLPFLTEEQANRLIALRPKLFALKLAILRRLSHIVLNQAKQSPWYLCWEVIAETMEFEDVEFLINADFKYRSLPLHLDSRRNLASVRRWTEHCGGIGDLVECIGHYERELEKAPHAGLSERIMSIPGLYQRTITNGRMPRYASTFGESWHLSYASALDEFIDKQSDENEFWSHFNEQALGDLQSQLRKTVTIPVSVPACKEAKVIARVQTFVGSMGWSPHSKNQGSSGSLDREAAGECFRGLRDLEWNEVFISFISEEQAKISARGMERTYRYDQMGFADRRTADSRPNSLWSLLLDFAGHEGQLEKGVDPKALSRLSAFLRRFFAIDEAASFNYNPEIRYKLRFNITRDYF